MYKNYPIISVVMPVYNCEDYIYVSTKSILEQSYSNFELIIINDGSTDGTLKILESFKDKRIKIFSQENMGISKSLNRGIELSQGVNSLLVMMLMIFPRMIDFIFNCNI